MLLTGLLTEYSFCLEEIIARKNGMKALSRTSESKNGVSGSKRKSEPAIPRTVLAKLFATLGNCLRFNTKLRVLEIDGVQLNLGNLELLASGLAQNRSIESLSVRRCFIGDRGCQLICDVLGNHAKVTSIDFSACHLSETGALYVAQLLQYHNLNRYQENWKGSLRYRIPDAEAMPGLRRLTISHNDIGDQGAQHIIRVLIDDRWIKAVDMQNCQLTEYCGQQIVQLFESNDTIAIVDVRNNSVSQKTVAQIVLQSTKRRSKFDWQPDAAACLPRTPSHTAVKRRKLFPAENTPPKTGTSDGEVAMLWNHLDHLKQQLQQEVAKRKLAEMTRDKAQSRLETHYRALAATRAATRAAVDGRVLLDKGVIQQMNDAFSDLNHFLAMIRMKQLILLSRKPSHDSYVCYDDEPTSTDISDKKITENLTDVESDRSSGRSDQQAEIQSAGTSSSPQQQGEPFSDESDPSWTTMASRTSVQICSL